MDVTDPIGLLRLRDSVYAADLLIVAIAELDLFTRLREHGGLTEDRLCQELELDARAADVMVTYLVALGLLQRAPNKQIVITPLAASHLVAGAPADLRAYFSSLKERPACAELLSVLRTGKPAAWASATTGHGWEGRLGDVLFANRITAAMDARGALLAAGLATALADIPAHDLLDVAGGSGVYSCALVDRRPGLRATVFERPPVDQAARTLLADRGYAGRIDVKSGDMLSGALPRGHDLHLFSHVLHDWDEERVRCLLSASFAALRPGGWVVDHDSHVNASKTGPLAVAEYSVLLMHATPGKCWSVSEIATFLEETGFSDIECRPTAGGRTATVGRRPRG